MTKSAIPASILSASPEKLPFPPETVEEMTRRLDETLNELAHRVISLRTASASDYTMKTTGQLLAKVCRARLRLADAAKRFSLKAGEALVPTQASEVPSIAAAEATLGHAINLQDIE